MSMILKVSINLVLFVSIGTSIFDKMILKDGGDTVSNQHVKPLTHLQLKGTNQKNKKPARLEIRKREVDGGCSATKFKGETEVEKREHMGSSAQKSCVRTEQITINTVHQVLAFLLNCNCFHS